MAKQAENPERLTPESRWGRASGNSISELRKSRIAALGCPMPRSALKIERNYFVQFDGWDFDHDRATILAERNFAVGDEQSRLADTPPVPGRTNAHCLARDGNHFTDGSF